MHRRVPEFSLPHRIGARSLGVMNRGFAFVRKITPFIIKRSDMEDGIKAMILWGIMALAAFIVSFFIPVLWIKIVNWVFGGVNMLIVLSWAISTIQARREYKKLMNKEE